MSATQREPWLPPDTEAVCLLCGQSFRNKLKYYAHRDMRLPYESRSCIPARDITPRKLSAERAHLRAPIR